MNLQKKPTTQSFWFWLANNTDRIQSSLKQHSEAIPEEIGNEFEKSFPGLVWEISPAEKAPWLFCVSANGDPELFSRVQEVAREAPKMSGWQIQAFRPRGPLDAEISMNGLTLSNNDIWCEVETIEGAASVVLHIRGVTLETEEPMSQMALILMDNAIGEYDSVMKIVARDLALLEGMPNKTESFFPLRELPAFLDRITIQ